MQLPHTKSSIWKENLVKRDYPDFYSFLMNLYPDSVKYNEKLYRYMNNIQKIPKCPVCGENIPYRHSPAGYGKFCSSKCMGLSKERQDAIFATKMKRYGSRAYNNHAKAEQTKLEKYGDKNYDNPAQRAKTNIERYGVDNVFKLNEYQQKACNTKMEKYGDPHYVNIEKSKQTSLKRYGYTTPLLNPEIKAKRDRTMMQKYGVKYTMLSPELAKKVSESLILTHKRGQYIETHRKNKSFNTSKIEKDIIEYFEDKNIEYIYQYKSDLYPYNCDFYLPLYDVYIEIQGCWTHGLHPFDFQNSEDIAKVERWKSKNTKFYNKAVYVWTDLDVRKRKIAYDNKLNYLEIFSIKLDEVVNKINDYINKVSHNEPDE